MKKILNGIILFSVLCSLLVTSLASCSASRPVKSSDEDLKVVGTVQIENKGTEDAVTSKTFDVLYEELRYITVLYKNQIEQKYGKGIWDNPETAEKYRTELENMVKSNITANYAVLSLCHEVGINPDLKEIQQAVKDRMAEITDELGGRKEYKKFMKEQHSTDHLFRFILSVDFCQRELFFTYTQDLGLIEMDEETIYDYIMADNFVRTLHVYIQNDKDDSIEENRKKAHEVRDNLKAGEDIKKIIGSEINEDFQLTTTDGYYFTKGEMVQPYEDAAFSLGIGQISDVVETSSGFYIIQRMPLEAEYVMKNLVTLMQQYQQSEMNRFIDERQKELGFEFSDYGRTLDLTKIS